METDDLNGLKINAENHSSNHASIPSLPQTVMETAPPLASSPPWIWLAGLAGLGLLASLIAGWTGLGWLAVLGLLMVAGRTLVPSLYQLLTYQRREWAVASLSLGLALFGILALTRTIEAIFAQLRQPINWEAVGALGEVLGAAGQILIAILAAYIAWRQYVISRDLTIQQNRITQQQTIDTYFQGISDLVLDPDGQLDDWPLERAIAEGRTAAILGGVDREGRAKILRFLSVANLLSPLRRDDHLGRPILDGRGGYLRDRVRGIRVIALRSILEGADLHSTDLRGIDLSDTNLERANLGRCDLSYANLCRTDLRKSILEGADLSHALLFVGSPETATPANCGSKVNFKTGSGTGAVVEGADFRRVQGLSSEQRQYLCAWAGPKSRATIPGGCAGIPNRLGEKPLPNSTP